MAAEGKAFVLRPDGGRFRKTVYGKTRDDVARELRRLLGEVDRGIVAQDTTITVARFLEQWLDEVAKRGVRPSTYRAYEMFVRVHIVPAIGRKRLHRLTAPDVRRLVNAKLDGGLSASTVRKMHAVLRAALEQAMRDDLLSRNVAKLVRVPSPAPPEIQPYTPEEARQLLQAAEKDRLYALWAVALALGLRKGEAIGLRWQDVDLDDGWVRVRQTVQRVEGSLRFMEPKTKRSRRTIPLPAVCAKALKDHKARQANERLKAGKAWQDHDLVFPTSVGTPTDPDNVNREFNKLCERANVRRVRVHDLRHTCATLLLAQGVPLRVVMEILGHSQISVTANTYTHVLSALQQDAMTKMDDILGGTVVNGVVRPPRRRRRSAGGS